MEVQKLLKRKSKAIKDKNESLLCSACADLAEFYMNEENYNEALEEYEILAKTYKKQNKMIEFATANRGLGEVYVMLTEYDTAIDYQRIHLELSRKHENKLEEQRALASLGHTYLTKHLTGKGDIKDLKAAEKYCLKSLEVCERLTEVKKYEMADMTARLYINLALIKQSFGNYNESIGFFNKAIVLCKANDVYEALQKAYSSLASLYEKRGELKNALQNFNLALDTAKKFKNKTSELCECLSSKANVLLKLGDIQAAKKCYQKAYKLKLSGKSKKDVRKKLKTVIDLYKTEKEMVSKSCSSSELQSYYEKIGDGFSSLRCFDKASEYYQKMLIEAEKTGNNLPSCYYSLAATYRDNEEYDKAVEFFEKEYVYCDFKKGLDTLCEIADTKESGGRHYSEVQKIYERAIKNCKDTGNEREEGRILKRLIEYLKRTNNTENITKFEEEFKRTNFQPTDTEDSPENSSSENDDIIDDLTDDSDESSSNSPRKNSKRNSFQVRRNLKGETQLHTACISGKANIVKHLLEQGHPVNIRDNGGWLPLHDACNNGHLDVVQMLLDKGAAINDRGGTHCNGTTPLHDASVNAHLEIVELLLDRGASPLAKTGDGETPYHYLKKSGLEMNFTGEVREKYENLLGRMSEVLKKAGQSTEVNTKIQSSAFVVNGGDELSTELRRRRVVRGNEDFLEEMRKSDESDDEIVVRRKSTTPKKKSEATNEYKMVMDGLRRKITQDSSPSEYKIPTKRPAFLMENEIVDDEWLEDDLANQRTNKKRKTNYSNELINSTNSRTSSQPIKRVSSESARSNRSKEASPKQTIFEIIDKDDEIMTEILDNNDSGEDFTEIRASQRKKKKGIQPKITHFGSSSPKKIPKNSPLKSPFKINSSMIIDDDPTLAMDVDIEGRSFRVTTKMSMKDTLTIKWLALEAARRYAKKEYVEPVLELVTKNGAELVDDDLIETLFVTDSQVVEVKGRVLKWNLPHISKRYQEACTDMSTSSIDEISRILDTITISLDVKDKGFQSKSMAPLCKSLLRENRLLEIDFSNNFLSVHCVQLLTAALPTLENLTKLNLSCTNLHSQELSILANGLTKTISTKLHSLDLSENFIGDDNLRDVANLTQNLNLKELNLSLLSFTENVFEISYNRNVSFDLSQVEILNLSGNNFGNNALLKILSSVKANRLKNLDVSNNSNVSAGFLKRFSDSIDDLRLNFDHLNLSRCAIEDSEVFNLLRSSDRIESLNLSYTNITSLSLRKLLENSNVISINLIGCLNLSQYFDNCNDWNLNDSIKSKTIKINCDNELVHVLVKTWNEKYGDKVCRKTVDYILYLS